MRTIPGISSKWLVLAASVMVAFSGCSNEAKKARLLGKADEYFKTGQYEKAEIEYKNVLQLAGPDANVIARLGLIYFEQGRLLHASGALNKAIELQPANLDARLRQGYVHFATGRRSEAREAAIFVLQHRPADAEAPILLVEAMEQPKDAAQAREILQKLPTAESAPVLTALGLIHLRERKFPEAEALVERAQKLDPKFAPAQSTLAALYMVKKEPERAGKALAAAVEFSPLRSPVRLQYAQFNLQNGKADLAKQQLDEMIRTTPDFLPTYVLRANIAASEKRFEESITLLDKLLARDPLHPDALLLAARVRIMAREVDKGIELLEKAASVYTESASVHQQLGNAYLTKGELEKAAASLSRSVKITPTTQAILELAQVNIRQRNFGAAIAALTAFLQKNPTHGDAQLLLADAYRNQGELEAALSIYRQLAQSNPKNAQLQLIIGTVLRQQDKRKEAREALTKATELSAGFFPAVEQLVNLDVADKEQAAALKRITAFIAQYPENAAAHLLLAKLHLSQENGEQAEIALKKTSELQPDSPVPYSFLGQYYIKSNQPEKALPAWQAAAARSTTDIEPLRWIASLHEQKKDFAAARSAYEKILTINPKSGEALNNLASLFAEHFNELDKAQDMAQKARELLVNKAETADTLGWILFKKRQYARAFTLLNESGEKLPKLADAQFHLGMAHYMMGNEDEARLALEKALQLNATFVGADEARQYLQILAIDATKPGNEARALLDQALARRPDDPVVQFRLAAIYERDGNVAKALSAYETALNSNPSNARAALNAIRLYRTRNETTKALDLAKATRKLIPGDARIAHVLGRLAFESGDHLWSVGVLQEATRREIGNPEMLFDLGEASYSVGQLSVAENAFREAVAAKGDFPRAAKAREYLEMFEIARNPRDATNAASKVEAALKSDGANVSALVAKAALDEQKPDLKAAKQGYHKALARFPDFTPAKRQLAILYSAQVEDDTKAMEWANKAREAYPNDPEVAKALGILSLRQGNHTRAASLLQESARARGTDAEILYYLGMAQHQLKDKSGSTRSLKRALELGLSEKLSAEAKRTLAATGK